MQGEQENDDIADDNHHRNNDNDENKDEEVYHGGAPLQPVQPIISDELLNERIRSLC